MGQQCVLDPSRAPEGAATLWLQLQELPFVPRGDAGGEIDTAAGWDEATVDAYLDRVLDRIAEHAPGLPGRIVATHVLAPTDLARENRNAVSGDPYGGSAELDQSLVWRPGTGAGHRTGIAGLFHIGAFTHPGPGLGGGSGHLAAQHLLSRSPLARLRRLTERSTP